MRSCSHASVSALRCVSVVRYRNDSLLGLVYLSQMTLNVKSVTYNAVYTLFDFLESHCIDHHVMSVVRLPSMHVCVCVHMLAELLRKSAEHTLVDMVQLLFSR